MFRFRKSYAGRPRMCEGRKRSIAKAYKAGQAGRERARREYAEWAENMARKLIQESQVVKQ